MRLRQYELILDRVFNFVDKNPNVLTVALANAHKFVPERVTNFGPGANAGGGESLMGAAAIVAGKPVRRQFDQASLPCANSEIHFWRPICANPVAPATYATPGWARYVAACPAVPPHCVIEAVTPAS